MSKRIIHYVKTFLVIAVTCLVALVAGAQVLNTAPSKPTQSRPSSEGHRQQQVKSLLEQGKDAYNKKKYGKARELWQEALKNGDYGAGYWLGRLYEQGLGVTKDVNRAYAYYTEAATIGRSREALALFEDDGKTASASSQYDKGRYFVEKDEPNKAHYWFVKNAMQGDDRGQIMAGYDFYVGEGVKQDYNAAFKWFERATQSSAPISTSFCYLGLCYENGHGVEKNEEKAWENYYKAATMIPASTVAQKKFDDTGKSLTHSDMVRRAEKGKSSGNVYMMLYWYMKAANYGTNNNSYAQTEAQYRVGAFYYGREDYKHAVEYLTKAAGQANVWAGDAQTMLGLCYSHARGVTQDKTKAVEHFEKAIENGHWLAAAYLGIHYFDKKDDKKALKFFEEAAKHDNTLGQAYLGYCYETGRGTKKNLKKAFEYYQKSASGNSNYDADDLGIFLLANCYHHGKGCEQNLLMAASYYEKVDFSTIKEDDYSFYFEPHLELGRLYEKMNKEFGESSVQTAEAAKHYQQAYMFAVKNNVSFAEKEALDALQRLGVPPRPRESIK